MIRVLINKFTFMKDSKQSFKGYMAAFFRQVKIGVLTLTLEKKQ